MKLYLLSDSAFKQFKASFLEVNSRAYFSLSLKLFKMLSLFWFLSGLKLIFYRFFFCSDIAVIGWYSSKTNDVLNELSRIVLSPHCFFHVLK